MQKLIRLVQATALIFMLTTSANAQRADSLTLDSVYIALNDYKFVQTWAEFGIACEKTVYKLNDQLIEDAVKIAEAEKELEKAQKKHTRAKKTAQLFGGIALAEALVIILILL